MQLPACPLADQHLHSEVNDAQHACLTGTSQRTISHWHITAASRAHLGARGAHLPESQVLSLLVLIYICIMGISWQKNRLVLQFRLQQQRECLISWGLLCAICLPQSACYASATIKRRARIQFLWEFFWLFNLFCNHYWRIPRGAFFRMS